MTDEDAPEPERALAWARARHGGQCYGGRPYATHLLAAAEVLRDCGYGDDPVLMSAAYLHDTIEDTDAEHADIARAFGARLADIVDAVSDPAGATRAERKAAAYPRIRALDDAVRVKLADRIANVEAGGPRSAKYLDEQAAFRAELFRPGVADALWARLDRALAARAG
ncbi:MAG TPA: HD domain-containing protein [Gaiellales bacterium]|jgi:(p)ppGpp synthase/HD superfamily hydrolase